MNKFTAVAFAAAFAVSSFDASARPPNYDESKVAPYALEDPLAFADGRKLSGPEEWPARRAEILGYVRRGGQHGISAIDWIWTLDFADRAFTSRLQNKEK